MIHKQQIWSPCDREAIEARRSARNYLIVCALLTVAVAIAVWALADNRTRCIHDRYTLFVRPASEGAITVTCGDDVYPIDGPPVTVAIILRGAPKEGCTVSDPNAWTELAVARCGVRR